MENIPAQAAIPNSPPVNPSVGPLKKWPILVIILVIFLVVIVIYQAKTSPFKPTPQPTSTSMIKPPSFKTIKGSVLAVSKDTLSVQTAIGTESASLSKAKEILKTDANGKIASASASELTAGKQVLILASKDGQTIVSIILLK